MNTFKKTLKSTAVALTLSVGAVTGATAAPLITTEPPSNNYTVPSNSPWAFFDTVFTAPMSNLIDFIEGKQVPRGTLRLACERIRFVLVSPYPLLKFPLYFSKSLLRSALNNE